MSSANNLHSKRNQNHSGDFYNFDEWLGSLTKSYPYTDKDFDAVVKTMIRLHLEFDGCVFANPMRSVVDWTWLVVFKWRNQLHHFSVVWYRSETELDDFIVQTKLAYG